MRLEPRENVAPVWWLFAPVLALCATMLLSGGAILWAGASPVEAYWRIVVGSMGSTTAITETLVRATVLTMTGLAVAVAFRARLWNIGVEGQLYGGALTAVVLGAGAINLPPFLLIPGIFMAGAFVGALILLGPVLLKMRLGVDEVVTTLLLNFIIVLLVGALLEGPLKDPTGIWPQSARVISDAWLPSLLQGTRLHAGLLIAILLVAFIWVVNRFTVWGYEMKAVGNSFRAARFAGINVTRSMVQIACISGGLAGAAGVNEVLGVTKNLTLDLSPGYGYTGIVVAMLAQCRAIAVFPSACFIAAVFIGAGAMSRDLDVSSYIAEVITATALMCMLVTVLFLEYRIRKN